MKSLSIANPNRNRENTFVHVAAFVVPALAGIGLFPAKAGTTNDSQKRSMTPPRASECAMLPKYASCRTLTKVHASDDQANERLLRRR